MNNCTALVCPAALFVFLGCMTVGTRAQEPNDVRQARAEAMNATLDGINGDLEKYGGSWEKWGEANKGFREAVSKLLTPEIKWPVPQAAAQ